MDECRRVITISERQRRVSRAVFFTAKEVSNVVNQTDLDLVIGLAFRYDKAELAFIHEQEFSLDRTGLVQRTSPFSFGTNLNGRNRRARLMPHTHFIASNSALLSTETAVLRCPYGDEASPDRNQYLVL